MKALSIRNLVFCVAMCLCVLLITACSGVRVTPNPDGSYDVTPNGGSISVKPNGDGGVVITPGGDGNNGAVTPPSGGEDDPTNDPDKHEHIYSMSSSSALCEYGGVVTWRCDCGDEYEENVAPLGHDIRFFEGQAATCYADGYAGYNKCIRGGCTYSTYEKIPALGHDMQSVTDVAPTCNAAGLTNCQQCSRCDYSTSTEVPALGHIRVQIEGTAATCLDNGYYSYETCAREGCNGEGLEPPVEIPALGHDLSYVEAKEPNCTEFGWNAYEKCERCTYSTYITVSATGHTYENGYCHCGHADLGLHEHIWSSGTVANEPTCTLVGAMIYLCTDMNCEETKTEEIPALGHYNATYAAKASTCTSEGWSEYTVCSRCGYSTFTLEPMLPHSYVGRITEHPTCALSGVRTYTCDCGKTTSVEIAPLGHDFSNWYIIKDPTCVSSGLEERKCMNDPAHVDTRTVAKSGHEWGEWLTAVSATCTSEGQMRRTCQNDSGHVEMKVIPVAEHRESPNGICLDCGRTIKVFLDTPIVTSQPQATMLSWTPVSGADHYEITVGSFETVKTYSTSLNMEQYYGLESELPVRIRAMSPRESDNAVNSHYCQYDYIVPGTSIMMSSGVGDSVNLLTGTYTDFASGTTMIFDEALFSKLRVKVTDLGTQSTATHCYDNLSSYVDHLTMGAGAKMNIEASAGVDKVAKVTGGYSFEVDKTYDRKSQGQTTSIFYDMNYVYNDRRVELYGYNDTEKLSSILSAPFLADAAKVQNGQMTPEMFIRKYGTHIVTSGIYGGEFNIHYEIITDSDTLDETFTQNTKEEINSQISATLDGVDLGLSTGVSGTTNYNLFVSGTTGSTQIRFTASAAGGIATGMAYTSLEGFRNACNAWADNIANSQRYVLIDVADESLFFVWDFLGDEYSDAKDILTKYFYAACDEQYFELKDKISNIYQDSFIFDEETGTLTVNFSGIQPYGTSNVSLHGITYEQNGTKILDENGVLTIFSKFDDKDVKKVVFKGGYHTEDRLGRFITNHFAPLTIKFDQWWSDDIVIEFDSFALEGVRGKAALDISEVRSENITIIVTNAAYFKGGVAQNDQHHAPFGINSAGKNVVITGSGELDIVGGNGANGSTYGRSGTDGGIGIVALAINFDFDGSINVYGGNGGNGYIGETGANGSTNTGYYFVENKSDLLVTYAAVYKYYDAGAGDNGKKGGNGGNGAIALYCDNFVLNQGTVKFVHGDGGDGAKGGTGGNGGSGANYSGSADWWGNWMTVVCPGKGGNAGNGGDGGNAGHAGSIEYTFDCTGIIIQEGSNGKAGVGGDGGKCGSGGSGGYNECIWHAITVGAASCGDIHEGTPGRDGNP